MTAPSDLGTARPASPDLLRSVFRKHAAGVAVITARGRSGPVGFTATSLASVSAEGKEIAARLALRIGSGIVTDAVDLEAGDSGPVATQSVFAASYTTKSPRLQGHPGHHGQAELGRRGGRSGRRCGRGPVGDRSPPRRPAPRSPAARRASRPAAPS
ncbi:hypothetical protein SGRIM128S_06661 [Streptomyces griseomycini]